MVPLGRHRRLDGDLGHLPNARILRQNPNAAITIDESLGSFAFRAAVIRGQVEVIDHPADRIMNMVKRIYRRYLTDDEMASTEGESILATHHVLLRFHPHHLITWDTTGTDPTAVTH